MVALLAEISVDPSTTDEREAKRRKLRLVAEVAYSQDSARVLILNMSKTGMMIETAAVLAVGESFEVDLPEAGTVIARVIWHREQQFGCAFDSPLSQGALSGALLQSPPDQAQAAATAASEGAAAPSEWDAVQAEWVGARAPATRAVVMAALTILAVTVIMFVTALLSMSVSAD